MALEKVVTVDSITVKEDGQLEIREATWILEDGERIGVPTFHRKVVAPGQDVSTEPDLVKDVAQGVHTVARISDFIQNRGN